MPPQRRSLNMEGAMSERQSLSARCGGKAALGLLNAGLERIGAHDLGQPFFDWHVRPGKRGGHGVPPLQSYCGKRARYSPETMNALTMSACSKLPLNWFSLSNQNWKPPASGSRRR